MAIFKNRLPSRQAILLTFTICAVPIHIWAIIAIFRAIPAWILSMSIGEMLGVMAYPLTFELIETLLVLAGLLVAAAILPARFYRDWFVSQSTLIVILASIWAVLMQLYGQKWGMWSSRGLIGLLPLAAAVVLFSLLNARLSNIRKALEALAERLMVLGLLYAGIDMFFLFVLIYRNLL